MKQLYVIGDPVLHSLSPVLHRAMIAETGVDYGYEARTVRAGELADFVRWARAGGCAGFNVTMPHKEAIVPLLDELDRMAAAIGAVNTVCIRQGRAIGHNTDGTGFLDSLAARGFAPEGKRAVLLGAGGAAKAVFHALTGAGAQVTVCARRMEQAALLAGRCPDCGAACAFGSVAQAAADCHLLINATPLGMRGKAAFSDLAFLQALPQDAGVYDLVYEPRETALLAAAAARGLPVIGGVELLVYQAVRAFAFFTGVEADAAAPLRAVSR